MDGDAPNGTEMGSNWAGKAAENADGGALPGCSHVRWSKDNSTSNNPVSNQKNVNITQSTELQGKRQYGGGNVTGLVGGSNTEHSNGMDIAVGGDTQKTGVINDDHGWHTGLGGGGRNGSESGVGAHAVISSGLGVGGFSTHPWQQDQAGSSDDLLILYGSPS